MTIRPVFKLLFASVIFLVASDALIEARAEAGEPPLVLSKNKIGPLKLDGNITLDLKKLRTAFTNLSVEQKTGQQDGPDFVYYDISDNEGELFWIKMQVENTKKIDSIHVTSPKIHDQYGLRIGSTYREVIHIRPRLNFKTDDHFHTYVGHPAENIAYELVVPYSENYQGPDRKPTKQEVERGRVKKLLWFPR